MAEQHCVGQINKVHLYIANAALTLGYSAPWHREKHSAIERYNMAAALEAIVRRLIDP